MPRNKLARAESVALVIAASVSGALLALFMLGVIPPGIYRGINLVALCVGGGLRLLAHSQSSPRWKGVDAAGKLIAYYGAFGVLFLPAAI
ncbi:hypothetical protein [Frigoribacterium sp. CFBP 13712]|uniref:hypothetical protein n=1 Tax=Frigoribacterium sp. CFBP 13712 TaxID=2775309 RepID=UPI0017850F3B|nr:hypothetical protein [Frigoribacterium sp. CFBP 13712]MBD8704907.1 hypothetical protein [Frigoribacterium sp. CFBP 13712]